MGHQKTALVLSAGGTFGAYQAGVWEVLARNFRPDCIIGASVGSLNGWVIAGGCPPEQLIESWLQMDGRQSLRWRLPRHPLAGIVDGPLFDKWVEGLYSRYTPTLPFGVVLTELPGLRPKLVTTPDVGWRHLAASCSVPLFFEQKRIDGVLCADGGMIGSLPLWAAAEMGATRVIAIHLLREASPMIRGWRRLVRPWTNQGPQAPSTLEVLTIAPETCLGDTMAMLTWNRARVEQWIELGRRDAVQYSEAIEALLSQ